MTIKISKNNKPLKTAKKNNTKKEKRETKIQKSFTDYGFGFPIEIKDVPMIKIRGQWTPNVNYNGIANALLLALIHKPVRLTGNEIRFIRQYFEVTLETFGKKFDVSHVGVKKWEDFKDNPTNMKWPTELVIRLFVCSRCNIELIPEVYKELENKFSERKRIIKIDFRDIVKTNDKVYAYG